MNLYEMMGNNKGLGENIFSVDTMLLASLLLIVAVAAFLFKIISSTKLINKKKKSLDEAFEELKEKTENISNKINQEIHMINEHVGSKVLSELSLDEENKFLYSNLNYTQSGVKEAINIASINNSELNTLVTECDELLDSYYNKCHNFNVKYEELSESCKGFGGLVSSSLREVFDEELINWYAKSRLVVKRS